MDSNLVSELDIPISFRRCQRTVLVLPELLLVQPVDLRVRQSRHVITQIICNPRSVHRRCMVLIPITIARLVVRDPIPHPVPEILERHPRVIREHVHQLHVQPSPELLQDLGQVPVVQHHDGFDVVLDQFVDEFVVEANPILVDGVGEAPGEDAGPGEGDLEDVHAQAFGQGDVFFELVVRVAGDVAVALVCDPRWVGVGVVVPNVGAFAVVVPSPFGLVGGCADSEEEVLGKAVRVESFRVTRKRGVITPNGSLMELLTLEPGEATLRESWLTKRRMETENLPLCVRYLYRCGDWPKCLLTF